MVVVLKLSVICNVWVSCHRSWGFGIFTGNIYGSSTCRNRDQKLFTTLVLKIWCFLYSVFLSKLNVFLADYDFFVVFSHFESVIVVLFSLVVVGYLAIAAIVIINMIIVIIILMRISSSRLLLLLTVKLLRRWKVASVVSMVWSGAVSVVFGRVGAVSPIILIAASTRKVFVLVLVVWVPLHLESYLLLLRFVLVSGFGHNVIHFCSQLLTRIWAHLLNEFHENFVSPLLLEFVLADFWETVNNWAYQFEPCLLACTVRVKAILKNIISKIAFNHFI